MYATRRRSSDPPLANVALELARALPALLGTQAFAWRVEEAEMEPFELAPAQIAAALARPGGLALTDRREAWTAMLTVSAPFAPTGARRLEVVSLTLPGPRERQLLDLGGMMALVRTCASTLGADVAWTDDSALGAMYHGRRAVERTRRQLAALPPEVLASLPEQTFEPVPGVAPGLPELLEPIEIDDRLVPGGVYWINWWNPSMIDVLERDRVEAAGWARIERHADGSMTLAATEAPPDLTSPEDVARLARIVAALELRARQERPAVTS
jgi:hypothetical protein